MVYAVLVVLTVLSCILFEFSGLSNTLKNLVGSYRHQFKVMANKNLTDEVKQKELMKLISKQVVLIGKLIFGIFLFIAPFLSLFLLKNLDEALNPDILITWWGLLIPIITVIFYVLLKRKYGKLFGNR